MALDRGTRGATFAYIFQWCAMLGALAGAGLGILDKLGQPTPEIVVSAVRVAFFGFFGGSIVGVVVGLFVVIIGSLFK